MRYIELSVAVRPEAEEAATELLRRYAPAGVSVEPPFEALDHDGAVALRRDRPVVLRAWLPAGEASSEAVVVLRGELRALGSAVVRSLRARTVDDRTWKESWRRFFPVLRIGRRLVVRPPWRRVRPRRDEVVITVDPGAAFGTGQHPTTRLCLEALEERIEAGATVLDVGCGSGILAVAAALLGAREVDAVDIDEAAVRATAENAARNGVEDRVRSAHGSLGARWPFAETAQGRYDLVLANLNARALQELAGELVTALRPAGTLVASGVIEEYEDVCVAAFERAGGQVEAVRRCEEWRALLVRRAEAPA